MSTSVLNRLASGLSRLRLGTSATCSVPPGGHHSCNPMPLQQPVRHLRQIPTHPTVATSSYSVIDRSAGRRHFTEKATVAENVDLIEADQKEKTQEVIDKINSQISDGSYGRLFAVVAMEFHQHKVTAGDLLCLNFDLGAPNGAKVRLEKALLVGSKDFTLFGRPLLPRDLINITATVVEKSLSHTKVTYRKFRKARGKAKNSFRWNRDYNTTIRINSIDLLKPIDQTLDRSGFEPLYNSDPTTPVSPFK